MSTRPPETSTHSKEASKEIGREKASQAWNKLSTGLQTEITAPEFLTQTRTLLDHMGALSGNEQHKIKKAFSDLNKYSSEVIKSQIKPALLQQITSHTSESERSQDLKVAELLGLLGNRFGIGADTETSQALGPNSPIKRRQIQTTLAAGATLTATALVGKETFLPKPDSTEASPLEPLAQENPLPATATPSNPSTPEPAKTPKPPEPAKPVAENKPSPTPESIKKPNTTAETPPPPPSPEPVEKKETAPVPQSEYIGMRVNSVEAIKALPPSIKIIRIGGDSNLMSPDGSFIENEDYDYEAMLKTADEKGLEVVFAYKASWFPGVDTLSSDEDLERTSLIIGNHLKRAASHPSVKYLEIGNEIDQGITSPSKFWEGEAKDYGLLFKMAVDNVKTINEKREPPVELILSSFADPLGKYHTDIDKFYSDFVDGLTGNGVNPGDYLVAAHTYDYDVLEWVINNLQSKVGAKGIIITEFNVDLDNKRKPAAEELDEMIRLIEEKRIISLAHEFKPENARTDNHFALSPSDDRFKVIMASVDREIENQKNPNAFQKKDTPQTEPKIKSPEGSIQSPPELSLEEFREWEEKHKEAFDSVITESLFTKELGFMTKSEREEAISAIALAHAKAIVGHYGDTDAIIGLDPGHGVGPDNKGDVGSATRAQDGEVIAENKVTWQISQLIAQNIMELSKGRYNVIMLRPENPPDRDMNNDGSVENWDRIRPRKTLLAKEVARLREDPNDWSRDVLYCSVHLNGSENPAEQGTEVWYPSPAGVPDPEKINSSKTIAEKIQREIVAGLRETGYPVQDRGIKQDAGKPYVALRA